MTDNHFDTPWANSLAALQRAEKFLEPLSSTMPPAAAPTLLQLSFAIRGAVGADYLNASAEDIDLFVHFVRRAVAHFDELAKLFLPGAPQRRLGLMKKTGDELCAACAGLNQHYDLCMAIEGHA
jgi:hypothetical protein